MEALLYLIGLTQFVNDDSPYKVRQKLFYQLRERFHEKRKNTPVDVGPLDQRRGAPDALGFRIARDSRASASVLSRLSRSNDKELLMAVAEHERTSPLTLAKLAHNNNPEVRQAVADNQHAPRSVLAALAKDVNPDVRYRLAENYHVCATILKSLQDDDNPYVSVRATKTLERLERDG